MSVKMTSLAWEIDMPMTDKMVLLVLCDHAGDDGRCWPSIPTIARKSSCSEATARRALKRLIECGYVHKRERDGRSSMFTVDPLRSDPCQNDTPVTDDTPPLSKLDRGPLSKLDTRTIKEPSKEPSETDFDFSDFQESWNAIADECGLPKLVKATTARRRAFNARRKEFPDIDSWKSAFRTLRASKWLRGEIKPEWRADADFFLQPKSFTKCVEGSYA